MQQPSILSSIGAVGKDNSRGGNHTHPSGPLGACPATSTHSGDTTTSKTLSTPSNTDKDFFTTSDGRYLESPSSFEFDHLSSNTLNIINLSNPALTQVDENLLAKGLNFCPDASLDTFGTIKNVNLFARKLYYKSFYSKETDPT